MLFEVCPERLGEGGLVDILLSHTVPETPGFEFGVQSRGTATGMQGDGPQTGATELRPFIVFFGIFRCFRMDESWF